MTSPHDIYGFSIMAMGIAGIIFGFLMGYGVGMEHGFEIIRNHREEMKEWERERDRTTT